MTTQSRTWCFTLNNWTEEEYKVLLALEGHKQIRYMIFGKEIGEELTPHLQGYIVFHNPKKMLQVKAIIGERTHIEKSKGNAKQNQAYCSKDEQYIEFGEIPQQGVRKDIEEVKEMVKDYMPIDEIIFSASSYQSARHAELLFKYQKQPPAVKRTIKWYHGGPGTGKTRKAVEEAGDNYYKTMNNLEWWDGYTGQKVIIIDDFRKDFCKFHELLNILDRYPYRLKIKGSSIWMQPTTTTIIITSPKPPQQVYDTHEDLQQLLRRIDEIKEFV